MPRMWYCSPNQLGAFFPAKKYKWWMETYGLYWTGLEISTPEVPACPVLIVLCYDRGWKALPTIKVCFASHCWETLCCSRLTLPLGTTVAEPGAAVRYSERNWNAFTTDSFTSPSPPPLLSELLLVVRQKLTTRALQSIFQALYCHQYLMPCQERDPSSFVPTFLRFLFPSPQ